MYKRISAFLFPVTAVLLIGALVWGYQENQEKNSLLIKAENQYQRAFHDLSYHMDQLHSQLGNAVAVNAASNGMHRKSLVNVWRLTSEAQNEVNQLPLSLASFNHAEDLLSRMSNFAYQTSVRDLSKEPLNDKELKNLKALYQSSKDISKDLHEMQSKVLAHNLRWMDVESAIATEKQPADNTIIDGFQTVDKKVEQYAELDWGPTISSMYDKRSVKMLKLQPTTPQEIQTKAAKFAALRPEEVKILENGKDTEWASYTAVINAKNGVGKSMDFTRNGGLLISYSDQRPVGKKAVNRSQAIAKANSFLNQKGYKGMKPVAYDEYDNMASITFVPIEGNVLIYPEKVTVRSGLDNGEVIGLQASDYIYEHHQKAHTSTKAKLSVAKARKFLNPEFKEMYARKAMIENELSKHVLCYEFGGRINGSVYRIYINANTGEEEKIEEVMDADENFTKDQDNKAFVS
ncbi:germination protein YpeB [Paenibacillus sp. P96]|uniref:Germination protein YpeB n=1 Tax=Paenibacillus zeirhizosphaerae TaxID=2987519 RepID=A0ABT9FQ82_9BACL|nr:germination protein YpeB [Paenibacillus sp. P96]MDP4096671.1 germination protein YpeB [Paenibacillus sp. P96]